LLLAALAGAILAPFVSVDAAQLGVPTRTQKQKTPKHKSMPAVTTKSRHGNDKTPNTSSTHAVKKTQDDEVTPNRGTIDTIGAVARGQTVTIRATALKTGESCALQIFYADKPAKTIRDVTPNAKKRCEFSVDIPDRPGAVGEAKAKLILSKTTSGKPSGEARQVFSVT
jgi:hypothetical protein